MTRLVSGVISTARDRHAAFDPKRFPNGMLYRFLADYCQEAQGKIMSIDPTYNIEITLGFTLPLTDFDAGLALGPGRIVTEVTALDARTVPGPRVSPVALISRDQRFARNGPPVAAWQESEVLYLRGPEIQWRDIVQVQVQVVESFSDADVTALQTRNAVLPLPNAAALMVIEALAHFMARRGHIDPKLPPIVLGDFVQAKVGAEESFYRSVADRQVGRAFFTADDWS